MTKEQVNDTLFSLNYVLGQIKTYGEKDDYDHELMIRHLEDVIKNINAKNESENNN